MTVKNGDFVDKLKFINNLILNSLKYVNNYSEFIGNSILLNWSKYVDNPKKERYLERVLNTIDKLKKLEDKQYNEKFIQEIVISNLLYINKNKNMIDKKYAKYMMNKIQTFNDLGFLLKFLVNEYLKNYNSINVLEMPKLKVVPRKKREQKVEKYYLLEKDNINNSYYLHIKFDNSIMIFDEKSFEYEKDIYNEKLNDNCDNPFFTDSNLKYSVFEKKRRIYIKSMYDLDRMINDLYNKSLDIIYPVDKVFSCALEIVDNIYKEIVNYNDDKSVLNSLMNKTIEAYGSVNKIAKYQELVDLLISKLPLTDISVKEELASSATNIIVDKGYKEFRNIKGIFPNSTDLYVAANEKISLYIKKNVKNIVNNLDILSLYTKYMTIDEIVSLYFDMKDIMIQNRINLKIFVNLQEFMYNLILSRFNVDEKDILNKYFMEEKLFK